MSFVISKSISFANHLVPVCPKQIMLLYGVMVIVGLRVFKSLCSDSVFRHHNTVGEITHSAFSTFLVYKNVMYNLSVIQKFLVSLTGDE